MLLRRFVWSAGLFAAMAAAAVPQSPNGSRSVFERRIRPLLTAKNPSSCSECHLSGVDLKTYIRPTEAETFAALRAEGMLDPARPDASKILRFIRMARPKSPLVTEATRRIEYDAFREWIVAASRNTTLRSAKAARVGPTVPLSVVRHTRIDSVVASFERNVWSQEGRCMGCHRPDNKSNIAKYGSRVAWFVPGDPEATMNRLIAQGDIDVAKPERSLLLLKPLNQVPHGGGVKMMVGDAGYKLFRAWIDDYAASVQGRYRAERDLPKPSPFALVDMNSILNVTGGPASWNGKLVRADLFAWAAARAAWEATPVATGERGMSAASDGTTTTNLILFLIVPTAPDESRATVQAKADALRGRLRPGRYLIRYSTLSPDAAPVYQGQQEFVATPWFRGWGAPVKVPIKLSLP